MVDRAFLSGVDTPPLLAAAMLGGAMLILATWRHSGRLALFAIMLSLLAGCGTGDSASRSAAVLHDRPTLPAMVRTYEALLHELRTSLEGQLGAEGWSRRDPSVPTALCQDFGTEPDTGLRTLPFLLHDRFVAGSEWEWVAATVQRVAKLRGFDQAARVVDRADEHRLALADRFGAELTVQDGPKLLSIGLITGCHLRTEQPVH